MEHGRVNTYINVILYFDIRVQHGHLNYTYIFMMHYRNHQ